MNISYILSELYSIVAEEKHLSIEISLEKKPLTVDQTVNGRT